MQWSDYTTGQRIKFLRGRAVTQSALAEMTGLSIVTVQKAEQNRVLTLTTLMLIADALGVDISVVLGEQAPRRAMDQADRTMVRTLSQVVHDTAAGLLPAQLEDTDGAPGIRAAIDRCWRLYWKGHYVEAGALAAPLLQQAAMHRHNQSVGNEDEAWGLLADAYRLSAYVANLMGARDLAYAAIGHAQFAAERSADELQPAIVASGRSWIYLRDARLPAALQLAEKAATDTEPRFSQATPEQLTVYGSHINFAAVVASRLKDKERTADYLSQSHAVGARMDSEHKAYGTLFGPVTAVTQAVGINVALGQTGKALKLIKGIREVSQLTEAAQNRYAMDKAMAQADASLWDASLDTLEETLTRAPQWARHQALPGVIVAKVGQASTARLRRVTELLGGRPSAVHGFPPATARTAL
ncbi:helix-turn-helix transcriptional regulator [Streptomyces sp. NPDC037389]|uniref:helix-turn-helix domain-containing protein n=1 Tax=Streptomyces sp. NPDC037389 TaxID=3155369 RepID=UPI0033F6D442